MEQGRGRDRAQAALDLVLDRVPGRVPGLDRVLALAEALRAARICSEAQSIRSLRRRPIQVLQLCRALVLSIR